VKRELKLCSRLWKDPETPWISKILLGAAVVYAVSPVDIIPDFIPVIGYLDDFIILPTLIWLAFRFIPQALIAKHRKQLALELEEQKGVWS
jgi:uncharacterized membrane protein YkvA (DUF1232 family)